MAMFVFGVLGIASLFSLLSFSSLAWRRWRSGTVWRDPYFWLSLGIATICVGMLEFAVVRTFQAATHDPVPFVQNGSLALTATALIFAGLACFLRAKALAQPHVGRWFLVAVASWGTICLIFELLGAIA